MNRLFRARWAGGWAATRVGFGLAALATHFPRFTRIEDAYASSDMIFGGGPFNLSAHLIFTPPTAWVVWMLGVIGALGVLWGGRFTKAWLLVFVGFSWLLISAEALNIKAYDRLLTWIALAMLLAPVGERGLHDKWRGPVARWFLMIVFMALYGSTGWLKALCEPAWWDGTALANHLVHNWFASKPLGAWISGHPVLYTPMAWLTVIGEASFPFLIVWRRTNPIALALCAAMHLGIFFLMDVGPFSFVALAAYPALLHPELGLKWFGRARLAWDRRGA